MLVLAFVGLLPARGTAQEAYTIDPDATRVEFSVKFLGVIPVQGVFTKSHGVFERDPRKQAGRVEVVIDTRSLRGGGDTARGREFFDVDRHPEIRFRSTRFVWHAGVLTAIEGELGLRGVARPVRLAVSGAGCSERTDRQSARCIADGEVKVSRAEFGMHAWRATLSDEVSIRVHLVATRDVAAGP
jgi:polyisoprenoid-binding protein YceI